MPLLTNTSRIRSKVALLDVTFLNVKNVIIVCSFLLGILALIQIARGVCRNTGTVIIILLCGLVHELYGVVTFQVSLKKDGDVKGCIDFYLMYIVPVVLTLAVILLSAIYQITREDQYQRFRIICLVYLGTVVPILVMLKSEPDYQDNDSSFRVEGELVFLKSCRRDPSKDLPNILVGYVLLYIPFLILFCYIYKYYSKVDKEFTWRELPVLGPCKIQDGSPHICPVCLRLNPVIMIMLFYYALVLVVIRPGIIIYYLIQSKLYDDLLTQVTVTTFYLLLSVKSITITCSKQSYHKVGKSHLQQSIIELQEPLILQEETSPEMSKYEKELI